MTERHIGHQSDGSQELDNEGLPGAEHSSTDMMNGGSTCSEYNSSSMHSFPSDRSRDNDPLHSGIPIPLNSNNIREIGVLHQIIQMPTGHLDMDTELDLLLPEIENMPAETDERIHHRSELRNFLDASDSLLYLQPAGRNEVHPRYGQTEPYIRSVSQPTDLGLSEDIEKYRSGSLPRRNSTHTRYLAATTIMALAVGSFVLLRSYRTVLSLITSCGLALLFEGLGLFFLFAAFFWTLF